MNVYKIIDTVEPFAISLLPENVFDNDGTFGWSNFSFLENVENGFPNEGYNCTEMETSQNPMSKVLTPPNPPISSPTTVCATISHDIAFPQDLMDTTTTAKGCRRVHFLPWVHVRTHTLVVGDHPCCHLGMAMQLGWESSNGEPEALHYQAKETPTPRLSFPERVQRLHLDTDLSYFQLFLDDLRLCPDNRTMSTERRDETYNLRQESIIVQEKDIDSHLSSQLVHQLDSCRLSPKKVHPESSKLMHQLDPRRRKEVHQASSQLIHQLDPRRLPRKEVRLESSPLIHQLDRRQLSQNKVHHESSALTHQLDPRRLSRQEFCLNESLKEYHYLAYL